MKNIFRSQTSLKNSLSSQGSAAEATFRGQRTCMVDLRLLTVVSLPARFGEGSEVELT